MLILRIIAILGIVVGAVSLVADFRKNGRKSLGVFICLIITSAALLALSFVAQDHIRALNPNDDPKAVANQVQPNDTADSDVPMVLDLTDPSVPDEPEELNPPANQGAEAADTNADNPDNQNAEDANIAANPENNDADTGNPENSNVIAEADTPENNEATDTNAAESTGDTDEANPPEEADPLAPTADAGPDINSAKVNEPIEFSGLKSKKKKASLKKFAWDFGDGTTAEGKSIKHAYKAAGTYTATLTVTDKDGHSGKTTRTIQINRPENKTRFIHQKLDDIIDSGSRLPVLSGPATKTFSGSQMFLDAAGNVSSSENCECTLTVTLKGPGCDATKSKTIKNGGEGDVAVKAVCKGELGEYTYHVERIASGSCGCSWVDIKVDGYEN